MLVDAWCTMVEGAGAELACCPQATYVDYAQVDLKGKQLVSRVQRDEELIQMIIQHLEHVYEAAKSVLEGDSNSEEVFVDDVSSFGRREELELSSLLQETRRLYVTRVYIIS